MTNSKEIEDLKIILESTHQEILLSAEKILEYLAPIQNTENTPLVDHNLEDIEKVKEACLSLQKELQRLVIDNFTGDSQALEDYLVKVRHDLRNVINIILGYTEMLIEDLETCCSPFSSNLWEIISISKEILNKIQKIKSSSTANLKTTKEKKDLLVIKMEEDEEFIIFKKQVSILVVDDVIDNCKILHRYLNHIGFVNIECVHDGLEAISILKTKKIDIVLLDVDMPKISGLEVLMRMKDEIIQRNFMVLMISAADTMENTIDCIRLGAEDFLPKPFNPELLEVRIGACAKKKWFTTKENIYLEKLKNEKAKYEKLLYSIFPPTVAKELVEHEGVVTQNYNNVAILFADIVGFTPYCDSHSLEDIMINLQTFIGFCEDAATKNNMQKIKTIGDCFLGVSGMLMHSDNPVMDCINWGEEILSHMSELPSNWQVRVGINYGTILGGIVGKSQYLFDVWGDAVNTASRIQTLAKPNTIYLSHEAWRCVEHQCQAVALGKVEVKGKNPLEIFSYEKRK